MSDPLTIDKCPHCESTNISCVILEAGPTTLIQRQCEGCDAVIAYRTILMVTEEEKKQFDKLQQRWKEQGEIT